MVDFLEYPKDNNPNFQDLSFPPCTLLYFVLKKKRLYKPFFINTEKSDMIEATVHCKT